MRVADFIRFLCGINAWLIDEKIEINIKFIK